MHALRIGCVAVLALAVSSCGKGDDSGGPATTRTAAAVALEQALWPDPGVGDPQRDPVAVARSFVEDFVGVENPALGAFREGDPRTGELPVLLRGEDGRPRDRVLAMVVLRRLDGERWFVTAAISEDLEISAPTVLKAIASPVRIAGRGVGFEGNIILRVHAQFQPKPLAERPVQAGAMKIAPFEGTLEFQAPSAGAPGAILARTGAPLAGGDAFTAFPVRLR